MDKTHILGSMGTPRYTDGITENLGSSEAPSFFLRFIIFLSYNVLSTSNTLLVKMNGE